MKFDKEILRAGLHVTGDGKGGRRVELITPSRIKHWVDQRQRMTEAGIDLLPAPAVHDPKAVPESSKDQEDKRWSQTETGKQKNYGFWENLSLVDTVDDQGLPTKGLAGTIDVPLQKDAEEVGKTVKSTSIYAKDFLDGKGNIWKDVLTHIYVGNNTIENGQKNFKPIPVEEEGHLATSMAHQVTEMSEVNNILDEPQANPDDLYDMLEKVAGIAIPEGTSPKDLSRALLAALRQKQLDDQGRDGGTVNKPPSNSLVNQVPVVMSQQQQNGSAQNADPNKTPEPKPAETKTVAMADFQQLQDTNSGLVEVALGAKRGDLLKRLGNLRRLGVIGSDEELKSYADKVGEITSMSFDDEKQLVPTAVEHQITALEGVKIPMPDSKPIVAMATQNEQGDFVIQPGVLPQGGPEGFEEVTEERADEIVNNILGKVSTAG